MANIRIQVPMSARDALLLPFGSSPDAHRGVWFYDPSVYLQIEVNDVVTFVCASSEIAKGIVTKLGIDGLPVENLKLCSRINGKAFQWEDDPMWVGYPTELTIEQIRQRDRKLILEQHEENPTEETDSKTEGDNPSQAEAGGSKRKTFESDST